jgi:hypothetical protein
MYEFGTVFELDEERSGAASGLTEPIMTGDADARIGNKPSDRMPLMMMDYNRE